MALKKISFYIFSFLLILSISIGCSSKNENNGDKTDEIPESVKDYQKIIEKGKLVILSENSSTSYFVYRGEKMGYEYEILREFAKDLGLELEIKKRLFYEM